MNIIDSINNKMAMVNLDVALDIFNDILDEDHFPKTDRDIDWARKCCIYSRCVHLNVWRDNTPIEIVTNKIIPLLKKAEEELDRFEEKDISAKKYKSEVQYYKANIEFRKENLANNYANGKPSDFPPEAMDPEMRIHLENVSRQKK